MNTFLGLLGSALPTSGTRLSVLSMELPRAITPTVAGLAVGAFVGVVGFIAVLLLVGRGSRRGTERRVQMQQPMQQVRQANVDQVFIPPYGTLQRDTPLPPAAFQVAGNTQLFQAPRAPSHSHLAPGPALPFRPSTNLSARAFAKMGYGVEVEDEHDSPVSGPEVLVECAMHDLGDDDIKTHAWASPFPAVPAAAPAPPPVSVSAIVVVVVEESGPVSTPKSEPHPLGIIPARSTAMKSPRPASFADLDMDDGATEIGETYFDEPLQPRRRTDPPKIRPVAPSGPRFPAIAAQQLPQPAPPPARAVPSARS